MQSMEENSVDAIVTDPPYGLSFMGKDWDHGVPGEHFWREAIRVAKPGAHLLAFGGTRTFHRLAVAIEDAGWEIRDTVMWVYGSGFPKSHDVSKAIDREAGAEREVVGVNGYASRRPHKEYEHTQKWGSTLGGSDTANITAPATDSAKKWEGWGTALKPAWEPIIVARKPLEGTVAENVQKWGTGAINIDGCRVDTNGERLQSSTTTVPKYGKHEDGRGSPCLLPSKTISKPSEQHSCGRWPANLIHDGSEEVLELFPVTKGGSGNKSPRNHSDNTTYGKGLGWSPNPSIGGDSGSAARFFYCAKASKRDRDEGCEGLEVRQTVGGGGTNDPNGDDVCGKYGSVKSPSRNHHPTVKPTDLMRFLCRLVTPPNGLVLDPFCGSGSTGKGAILEGFRFVGIEKEPEYAEIAKKRIESVKK